MKYLICDADGNIKDKDGNPIELTSEEKEAIRQQSDRIVKSCGNLPKELSGEWMKPVPAVIRWEQVLRRFATSTINTNTRLTYSRRNRFVADRRGTKSTFKSKLLVMFDESGSVDNEMVGKAYSELHALYKKGVEIDVCHVDTKIHAHYPYKGRWEQLQRRAQGGTDLTPGVELFLKGGYDGLVCFSDGEFYVTEPYKKARKSVWFHFPECKINQALPGIKLEMV